MSDRQVFNTENGKHALSQHNQQLINHLENLWRQPPTLSSESLKRINEILEQFPEAYKISGMTKIAEYLASLMGLHYLDIIATFQQKAEDEDISQEERRQTLSGIMPELFSEMMGISKQIVTRDLDALVTLSNITLSLYTLSQVNTAEEAQSWMYELPIIYRQQLRQEHLITSLQLYLTTAKASTTVSFSGTVSWPDSLPASVEVPPITAPNMPKIA